MKSNVSGLELELYLGIKYFDICRGFNLVRGRRIYFLSFFIERFII